MSDCSHKTGFDDETVAAALTRWSAEPGLGTAFTDPVQRLVVLDTHARYVLYAHEAADELRAAIADRDGCIISALKLDQQLGRIPPIANGSRLTRLRFDVRGVARPTTCRVALAEVAPDRHVLLIVPIDPLPALRRADASNNVEPPLRGDAEPSSPHLAASEPTDPRERFIWRSNGLDVVTQVSGSNADLVSCLAGRSWQDLAKAGTVVGDAVFRAMSEHRTFRALPIIVRPPDSRDEFEVELSGAPAARPNQEFTGFSGFGLVRQRTQRRRIAPVMSRPEPELPPAGDASKAILRDDPAPAHPLRSATAGSFGYSWSGTASSITFPAAQDVGGAGTTTSSLSADEGNSEIERRPAPETEASASPEAALSVHEHAAFREIARALGARFAGDDEAPTPGADDGVGKEKYGEVTPFPVPPSQQTTAAAIEAAIVNALDRLPTGVIVHRDGAVLFANRRILELTDCRDKGSLQIVAASLLGGVTSAETSNGPDETVSIAKPAGSEIRLLVERTRIDWLGEPANLILARPAISAEPAFVKITQGIAQPRGAVRGRDPLTLLDHLEDGVTTIDQSGRILSTNRSAKSLLSEDARDIVGGFLDEYFAPDQAPLVSASVREASEAGSSIPRDLRLRHRQGTNLRLRVTRLTAVGGPHFCATLREADHVQQEGGNERAPGAVRREETPAVDFLSKVDQQVRSPLNDILASVDVMLAERFGPLGSERYREYLREIQNSGGHVLGVVDDLMNLARIEAGRTDLTFTQVPLNTVIAACIAQMQPQAARNRILLRTSLSQDLQTLFADEAAMRQATLRVIENALRFTGAGGQVIVSTTVTERGEIAVRVRDTGAGMTSEELDRALRPFDRKVVAESDGKNLGGLGLTLTKALVEANRGHFRISSRKNEGTLVEMVFPVAHAKSA